MTTEPDNSRLLRLAMCEKAFFDSDEAALADMASLAAKESA